VVSKEFIIIWDLDFLEKKVDENKQEEEEDDEYEQYDDDATSEKSEDRNIEKEGLQHKRKIGQKYKAKYDPYAVLNKVRNEKLRTKSSPDRRFVSNARSETRLPNRSDYSPKISINIRNNFSVI